MLIPSAEKKYRALAFFAMALLACIIFSTFQDYGVSWDEEIQSQYGQAVFDYYASGFVDHRYNQLFNLYIYGGMFDGLAAFLDAYSPMGIYATRHLLNALFGLLTLWGTWRLARQLGGGQAGFFALLLLAVTPMFYGHIFNNPKDIPFAAGIVWTLYYMGKSLREFPMVRGRTILYIGAIFGLTLGVRVGGVMLLGYWGLALFVQACMLFMRPSPNLAALTFKRRGWALTVALARLFVPVVVASYLVMLFCWPWAQEAPFSNPLKALIQFSNFPQNVEVLLNGTTYMSTELPWSYLPRYFLVQLPLLHLGLILLTALFVVPILKALSVKGSRATLLLIFLMIAVPMAYAVVKRPALYDAVRHFIFTLPLLCTLGSLGLSYFFTVGGRALEKSVRVKKWRLAIASAGIAVFCLGIAAPVWAMVQLHPYEYIFVNSAQGGVKGAFGKYELDYWGSSFKEAAEKLQNFVASEGGVPPGRIYKIAICGPWSSAMIYLPPDYEPVIANERADFFLGTTRWMCQNMRPGREIIRVERLGVPLSVIKDLRPEASGGMLPVHP
jgi:hypothetical protein